MPLMYLETNGVSEAKPLTMFITCDVHDTPSDGDGADTLSPLLMPEYIPVDLTAIRKDTGKVKIILSLSGSNVANDTFRRVIFTKKRMKIEKDTIHLKESESNLPVVVFTKKIEIYNFRDAHRDKSDSLMFPFYIVGACSVTTELAQQCPDLAGLGATIFHVQGLKKRPLISLVWIPWAKDEPSGWLFPITGDSVDLFVGCVAAHELGHYGARLVDYEQDSTEHYSDDCLMHCSKDPNLTLIEPRFCYICIYRYRGNMYIQGDPIFKPILNRRFKCEY